MRLIVGYLATPSGEDGLVLGAQLARSLGARLDICMVLPPDRRVPTRVPAESGFEDILASRAQKWLDEARHMVADDIDVEVHLSFHESFAQGLLDEVERLDAQAIVVGASGDGLLGRHSVGSVSTELLHSAHVPLALAPRGTRHSSASKIREVTCALGTRIGADVLLRTAVRTAERMHTPLRLISLVSLDPQNDLRDEHDTSDTVRERSVRHAAETLEEARSALPQDFPVSVTIADGSSVESAVRTLDWQDGDLVMVGSSRLAQPRRLFLGSTATKMLRVLPVPMVVVPKQEFDS